MRQGRDSGSDLIRQISSYMANRTHVLNPFKLSPVNHMLRYVFTPREWMMWKELQQHNQSGSFLSTTGMVRLHMPKAHPVMEFAVHIPEIEEERGYPRADVDWPQLPEQVQQYINTWCDRDYELKQEQAIATKHVQLAINGVRTWGQLDRLWPNLAKMNAERRTQLLYKKARSALNDVHLDSQGQLKVCWRKPEMDRTEELIYGAKMLPRHEGPVPRVQYRLDPLDVSHTIIEIV